MPLHFFEASPQTSFRPGHAGQIVTLFGGVARAALIMCSVYVIGLIVPWFMPETAGEPLPE